MDSKPCFKCGETKPLSEFYTHKNNKDGHLNKCKACAKVDVKSRYQDLSSDPQWKADRNEATSNKRKSDPEWAIKERARVREYRRKQREAGIKREPSPSGASDELKIKARAVLNRAILQGIIKRLPCIVCKSKISEAHHEDYSKPLAVHWLCRLHHMDRHVHLNESETLNVKPVSLERQFKLSTHNLS